LGEPLSLPTAPEKRVVLDQLTQEKANVAHNAQIHGTVMTNSVRLWIDLYDKDVLV
jgi:hypothetical protein